MVALYFDESGNNSTMSAALMVGAVEPLLDEGEVEDRIVELWKGLSARRDLEDHRGFQKFRNHGFHATDDPPEVSEAFRALMRDIPFRAYIHVTDRTSPALGATDDERLSALYVDLLSDLLLRFKAEDTLVCSIEQNGALKTLFAALPDRAREKALGKFGGRGPRQLPALEVATTSKTELMSVALIDYVMLSVQRWLSTGRSGDGSKWEVRAFRSVEPSLSVLYSVEDGLISSRSKPLH